MRIYHATPTIGLMSVLSVILGCLQDGPHSANTRQAYAARGEFSTSSPSIFRLERTIVLTTYCRGNEDIISVDVDSGEISFLTDSDALESHALASDFAQGVVYKREAGSHSHIWLGRRTKSKHQQLTFGRCYDEPIAVSNDGRFVLASRISSGGGFGKLRTYFALDLKNEKLNPIPLGDMAVFLDCTDKCLVLNSAAGELYIRDLEEGSPPRRLFGNGLPVGLSSDSRFLFTARFPTKPTSLNYEYWVRDLQTQQELKLAFGNSCTLVGAMRDRLLLCKESNEYFVVDSRGNSVSVLPATSKIRQCPRLLSSGDRAIFTEYTRGNQTHINVMMLDLVTNSVLHLGDVDCDDATASLGANWFDAELLTLKK